MLASQIYQSSVVILLCPFIGGTDDDPAKLAEHPQPRNYIIPLLDLADQKQRQVVVDQEEGQYLGHPTTVLLEDNKTMIIVFLKGMAAGRS